MWLAAGKSYFIKALMKEGGGGDHLSVGVRYPGGKLERPITANIYLEPGKVLLLTRTDTFVHKT